MRTPLDVPLGRVLLVALATTLAACGGDDPTPPSGRTVAAHLAPPRAAPATAPLPAGGDAPVAAGRCRLAGTLVRDGRPADAIVTLRAATPRAWRNNTRFRYADDLDPPPSDRPVATVHGKDGSFEMPGLPPRAYRLEATTADGAVARQRVEFSADGECREVALRLAQAPAGHALRGRVVGADGAPFHGFVAASIEWEPSRYPVFDDTGWRETAADGSFELKIANARRVVVAALVPGHLRAVGPQVLVPSEDPYVLDLSKCLRKVRVHVFDEITGAPVSDADVGAYSERAMAVSMEHTDRDGVCTVLGNATERTISVRAPGYPDVEFASGEEAIDIPLRAGPSVRVHVVRADDSTPVADATVRACAFGSKGVTGGASSCPTGPNGVAEIKGLAPGGVLVFVLDDRWISEGLELGRVHGGSNSVNNRFPRRRPDWLPVAGRLDVELRVLPAGAIEGAVLRADGSPAAEAVVRAWTKSMVPYLGGAESAGPQVAAGPDGRFRIDGLFPTARYGLAATSPRDPGTVTADVDVRSPGDVVLKFSAAHWIEVEVLDAATGLPVPGAEVACADADNPRRNRLVASGDPVAATTDADGRARVGPVSAGEYDLIARSLTHIGSPLQRVLVTAGGSAAPRLTIRLERGVVLRGRAVLPDGRTPESGTARVEPERRERSRGSLDESLPSAPLAADGSFELAGLPAGSHAVVVDAACDARAFEGRAIVEGGGPPAEVRLAATPDTAQPASPDRPTFVVRVVDPDGRPVGTASVRATWTEDALTQGTTFRVSRGEVRLPLATRGTKVTVSRAASLTGIPLDAATLETVLPGDAADGFELRLAPGEVVAGSVVDEAGRPLAGAHVSVVPLRVAGDPFERYEVASGATATDGAFEIRGLDAHDYDLVVTVPEDFEPPSDIAVHGGQRDVRVTVVRGMRPVFVVLDADERPIAGAEVTVQAGDSFFDPDSLTAETGADGRATLPAVARGKEFHLTVSAPRRSDLGAHAAAWAPAPQTIVRLSRFLAIRGRVLDPDGRPMARVDVWWRRAEVEEEPTFRRLWEDKRTDASGRFEIGRLEPGAYLVVAGNYGCKSGRGNGGWHWRVPREAESVAAAAASRVVAGTSDVVLHLAATDLVRVRLVGLTSPIAADELPSLGPTGNGGGRPALATGDAAVLLFTGLVPRRDYELWARFPRLGLIGHAVIRAGAETSVQLEPGTALEGLFAVPEGTSGAELSVTYSIGEWRIEAAANADGSFVIPCLPRIEGDVNAWRYGAGSRWMGHVRGTPGTRVEATLTGER